MADDATLLDDPAFQQLLRRRARWRWGLSGFLIFGYVAYGIAGVFLAEAYSKPFLGMSIPWGMAIGYLIIALSIALSLVYVRVVNRLEDAEAREQELQQ